MTSYRSAASSSGSLSFGAYPRLGARRVSSVYGGAEGHRVRVSYASTASGFELNGSGGVGASLGDKATMQNLNDRLATYLEKVRSLESANARLETQIRDWYDKQTPTVRDHSKYEAIIADLQRKIHAAMLANARVLLQIDNAKLAAEDFKVKSENEMALRMSVEADISGLRRVLDEQTMTRTDLEVQIEGLKEELIYLKKNHKEELAALRAQVNLNSVNVEMDSAPHADLADTMAEIRSQYEGIVDKNRRDMEAWYKGKFDELNKQVAASTETLHISRSDVTELSRTLQALQIELQSQLSLKDALEGQLGETETRYSHHLSQLQVMVNSLETELSQVKADIGRQASEYQVLLDIKTRLEMEIAEYRRLLDGEEVSKTFVKEVQQVKVAEVKHEPVVKKVVRTVIEEVVDGQVVSRTEDVDTEIIKS